ncbi:MAG: UDP-N-acetylmuramate dehydrogenase [Deltaproteobacteria bacterium]|jgi:UDP-N-acetylmuramate dehydrogenase|nr:UDP-N-acetylmuramate dehydrogenase [Deltaproteobacteria bacterium]
MKGRRILPGPCLARRTTMGLGGEALAEVRVSEARFLGQAFDEALRLAHDRGGRVVFLGRGSNLLVREGVLPLVLLSLDLRQDLTIRENGAGGSIRAGADTPLAAVLAAAAAHGFSGLEALAGIPGSLGGALVMNAGSYGTCMADVTQSAWIFTRDQGLREVPAEDLAFAYRECRLKEKGRAALEDFLVTEVTVRLLRDDPARIRERMAGFFSRKRSGQPVAARSAGCVFKNPHPEHPAGRLLEEAGLRGRQRGGMSFSPLHANFLINDGQGAFDQAMELIAEAQEAVRRRSGFSLELEVRVWP